MLHEPVDRFPAQRTAPSMDELGADGDGRVVGGDQHPVQPVVVDRRDVVVEQQEPRRRHLSDRQLVGPCVGDGRDEYESPGVRMPCDDPCVVHDPGVVDDDGGHTESSECCEQRVQASRLERGHDDRGHLAASARAVRYRGEAAHRTAQCSLTTRRAQPRGCGERAATQADAHAAHRLARPSQQVGRPASTSQRGGSGPIQRLVLEPLQLAAALLGDAMPLGRVVRSARAHPAVARA